MADGLVVRSNHCAEFGVFRKYFRLIIIFRQRGIHGVPKAGDLPVHVVLEQAQLPFGLFVSFRLVAQSGFPLVGNAFQFLRKAGLKFEQIRPVLRHFKIPAFLVGCLRALDAVDVQTGLHLAYLFLNPVSGAVQLLSGGVPPAFEFFHFCNAAVILFQQIGYSRFRASGIGPSVHGGGRLFPVFFLAGLLYSGIPVFADGFFRLLFVKFRGFIKTGLGRIQLRAGFLLHGFEGFMPGCEAVLIIIPAVVSPGEQQDEK